MKLMNVSDFFKNTKCSSNNIYLYLKYLENEKAEIQASLELSSNLSLSEEIMEDFHNQIKFIDGLVKIIRESYSDMVAITVDKLSDYEVNNLIGKFVQVYCEEIKKVRSELDDVNEEVSNVASDRKKELENNGYKNEYYNYEDASQFFKDKLSSRNYLEEIITSDMSEKEIGSLFALVYPEFSKTLASMIIKLRKIVEMSNNENALSEVIKSFLSVEGIGKIIGASTIDECIEVFTDLQRKQKMNTEFFINLPEELKKQMIDEDFSKNGMYGKLKDIYLDYKLNGYVTLPAEEDKEEMISQVRRQYELDAEILEMQEKLNFLSSANTSELREYIKKYFSSLDDGNLSFQTLFQKVDAYSLANTTYADKSETLLKKIEEGNALADEITKYLESDNQKDFEILAARNSLRIMDALGPDSTEESVYPVFEAESRRVKQFGILVEAIKELNLIKTQIEKIDNSRNLIKNLSGVNKKERSQLIQEYQERCQACYNSLKLADLLYIVVSRSYFEKEEEIFMKPQDFKGIFNTCTVKLYEANESSFNELKLYGIVPEDITLDDLNNLFKAGFALGQKLFQAKSNEEGIFDFDLEDEALDYLIDVQKDIAKIYDEFYHARSNERKKLAMQANASISKELKEILTRLNAREAEVSKDFLQQHVYRLMFEVSKAQEEIGLIQGVLKERKAIADEVTLEDALAYSKMLEGIKESVLPVSEIYNSIRSLH